ncbi:fibronectin type-III domain-containing protein 3A-like [Dendronephthya gigantea]|uniref:fibronectin type-III domain-containing protein 3A-like n=1 Tax=Dendronephthya gigantea TaxID=151771 RepID=UPI00106C4BF4|nr:fibronectin type-III domain-containing protein 3A-like [Dendronephthya gigantea]
MNGQEEPTKVYTVRVGSQELSFRLAHEDDPPPKIRLYNGNNSIAIFAFNKRSDSYIELPKDDVENFDRALRALKKCTCRHSNKVNQRGDERLDKQLARLQRRLEERTSGDQCSYCEQLADVVNLEFEVTPSSAVAEKDTDDLKMSEPQITSLGSTSAKISWQESVVNNEHLANCIFELEMSKSKNTSFHKIYSGPEQSFIATGLLPGTKYYFRLCAVKDTIKGPFSPDALIMKEATAPSTPDMPHISNKTKTSLALKWAVKSDNGSRITSCVLQWDKGETDGQFETIYEGPQKQYKFNHKFPPKTTCRFRVKAINMIGESEFSPELRYTSSAGVPSIPDPPSLLKATTNSLQLSWKKPNTNGADITEYILQMDDEFQGYGFLPVYRGIEQTCIVRENLKRNRSYKFRLCAINVEGESKWSNSVSFTTKCEAPGRMLPPILEGKVHTKSFMVSWVPPSDDGGTEIVSFSLEVNSGAGGEFKELYKGLDTTFKIQDLSPGQAYKVRVSCSSSEFKSPWSDATSIKTLPVIPDPPTAPRKVKNSKPQAYAIELEWDAPNYDGGANIATYNVQIKAAADKEFRHVYLGSKTCCCATGLEPNCKYTFRVRAQNIAGESKFSDISCLNTGPGPPDAVELPEIACRSSSAINISWKVPRTNGTPVTSYLLQYAGDPNGPFEKLYEGSTNKYEMKRNILPSTTYFFRVQACSVAGCSDWSDVSSCHTSAAPPAQVHDLILLGRSATSLRIGWKRPHHNGAAVVSYNIDIAGHKLLSYVPEVFENDNKDSASDGETLAYTITDLQPNTQYRFRVQGVNKSGCGIFSSVVTATTGKIPPSAPVLNTVNCSYQSIKLRWSFHRPQSDVSELTYELQMGSNETSFETVFKGSAAVSHKVGKLQEQTMYSFRIRAANEAGYGPYSEIFSCQTTVQPPPVIKGLCYSNLSKNSVTLSWKDVPHMKATDSITYTLLGKRKENSELEQLYEGKKTSFTFDDVISEKTYRFQVCAVRTLANGTKIQSPCCPILSLTIPSEQKQEISSPSKSNSSKEIDSQPRELSERQLAGIFFVVFAFIVLLISLLVFFLLS